MSARPRPVGATQGLRGRATWVSEHELRHVIALDRLADLADWPAGAQWWDLLIGAGELMWLTDTAA